MLSQWGVFYHLELPRLLLSALVGAALALAGIMTQALFHNPLAEPTVLGISSVASLFGLVALITFPVAWHEPWLLGALMALGALVTAFGLMLVWKRYALGASTILLCGVLINAFCGGITQLLTQWMEGNQLKSWLFWNAGQFANATGSEVVGMLLLVFVMGVGMSRRAASLDALLLGEEVAYSMGVTAKVLQPLLLLSAACLMAYVLMVCGQVGFIGLMAPHLARQWRGGRHARLIPTSMAIGAALLLLADFLCQHIVEGGELPVGTLTTLMGVPLLVHALFKYR